MPRQVLGRHAYVGRMKGIAPISAGGSGASTPDGAVNNFGGISRSMIGVLGGLVRRDQYRHIDRSVLEASGISASYAIEGPEKLVHGQTSSFYITNYNSTAPIEATVSSGSVAVNHDEIRVTAPETGDEVVLTVNGRTLVLAIVDFTPETPSFVFPTAEAIIKQKLVAYTEPFRSDVDFYTVWNTVTANKTVSIPDGVTSIEVEGRQGAAGISQIILGSSKYSCGKASTRRRIRRRIESVVQFVVSGSGELRYRWLYPSAVHVSTDWQLASDPEFQNIVVSSMGDTVNLTSWTVDLPEGDYYIRSRFNGRPITV